MPDRGAKDLRPAASTIFETIGHVGEQKAAGKTLEEAREEGLPDRFALWNRKPRFVSEKK